MRKQSEKLERERERVDCEVRENRVTNVQKVERKVELEDGKVERKVKSDKVERMEREKVNRESR